ncbi:uncharacterized protein PFL1_00904 [Pseudozyma flocculosa PF-1]|uniref:uncharacterized protein n=1 Tax=Pseudozyma flocculosa PF-1 TaxID=1277687 RepID=UPI000456042D|nr:uncharacterized protein PFL1_00904 [Pseudozyma flocculosa PF-1]EPQ31571.1 hypothetical protein PFL1_00904 [Pseudozyma flocculosa PF-1]
MLKYQELKEMALRKTRESDEKLAAELKIQQKEAAERRAKQEAKEKAQREAERRLLIKRLQMEKEEAAKERARQQAKAKAEREEASGGPSIVKSASDAVKRKLLGIGIKSSNRSSSASTSSTRRRKSKNDEDDFVGNRADRLMGKASPSKPSSSATASSTKSTPKRRSVPLTREEKKQIKLAREFGTLPVRRSPPLKSSAAVGPARTSSSSSSSSPLAVRSGSNARSKPAPSEGLVALGTKKRDMRSIDEIERDLRRLREGKSESGKSQVELEREATMLRRQKAMEERRRTELEAREMAKRKRDSGGDDDDNDDNDDDLFGSGDESDAKDKPASKKTKTAASSAPAPSTTTTNTTTTATGTGAATLASKTPRAPAGSSISSSAAVRPRDTIRNSPPIPRRGGINPADFLPGAPLRAEARQRLAEVARNKASAIDQRSTPSKRSRSPADDDAATAAGVVATKKAKVARDKDSAASSPAPMRRETERDRFIREQEEKKAAKARGEIAADARPKGHRASDRDLRHHRRSSSNESEESEADSFVADSESGSDRSTGGRGGDPNLRDEIWKLFGKDRKQYASRVVDSDDDMEADASAVLQEELRSARQAREEDKREEELERKREREKALRKKAAVASASARP